MAGGLRLRLALYDIQKHWTRFTCIFVLFSRDRCSDLFPERFSILIFMETRALGHAILPTKNLIYFYFINSLHAHSYQILKRIFIELKKVLKLPIIKRITESSSRRVYN